MFKATPDPPSATRLPVTDDEATVVASTYMPPPAYDRLAMPMLPAVSIAPSVLVVDAVVPVVTMEAPVYTRLAMPAPPLVRRLPDVADVASWVERTSAMPPV
jgi:hypothetical protein